MWRALAAGWRVHVPVVVGNAVVQALTTAPFLTPGASFWFVVLAIASYLAFTAALALTAAQARAAADGRGFGPPSAALWSIAGLLVLLVSAVSLLSLLAVPVVAALALIVLPGAAARPATLLGGFRAFREAPVRAALLALLTIVVVVLLWAGGMLLGLFVTGWPAAGLTWLGSGVVVVVLLAAWTSLAVRHRR